MHFEQREINVHHGLHHQQVEGACSTCTIASTSPRTVPIYAVQQSIGRHKPTIPPLTSIAKRLQFDVPCDPAYSPRYLFFQSVYTNQATSVTSFVQLNKKGHMEYEFVVLMNTKEMSHIQIWMTQHYCTTVVSLKPKCHRGNLQSIPTRVSCAGFRWKPTSVTTCLRPSCTFLELRIRVVREMILFLQPRRLPTSSLFVKFIRSYLSDDAYQLTNFRLASLQISALDINNFSKPTV